MKKATLLSRICLVLLIIFTLFSTINGQVSVKFGAKLGVNSSNISFKKFDPARSERIGFHMGVTSEISFTESLALQPDLIFSSQGFNLKGFGTSDGQAFNYLNLTIPFAYKMNFVDVNLGPYIGFLLNKGLTNLSFTDANGTPIDTDPFINKLDVGMALGLTFHIQKFFVGTRYSLGFLNVGNGKEINGTKLLLDEGKNAVGQLSVGYYF
jgi:Outer membrane protein beta-barrel domain